MENLANDFENKISAIAGKFKGKEVTITVVSGNQYRNIKQYGIDKLLSPYIKLVYGPACVLCTINNTFIDELVEISHQDKVIVTVSPELMQVPGEQSNLDNERKKGYDIITTYTFQDILLLAKHKRRHKIVFPALGFETAAANTAAAVLQAKVAGLFNFTVISQHRNLLLTVDKWLKYNTNINALIFTPQDISVTGKNELEKFAKNNKIQVSVCGMQHIQLLEGIYDLLEKMLNDNIDVYYQEYFDIPENGLEKSQQLINEVFHTEDIIFQGLGNISGGGYELNDIYTLHNAKKRLNIKFENSENQENNECICDKILNGTKSPAECPYFKKECNPLHPKGVCMASKEGLCNIKYLLD